MGRPAKDKRDIFYRKAKEDGWRARSAYKLIHLNEAFRFFGAGCEARNFVDLCCAPGSWSQALSRSTSRDESKIVSVDLQDIAPIAGVNAFVGDITSESTAVEIVQRLGGRRADVVICDGAPDVSGLHDLDEFLQSQLVVAAATIAAAVLVDGGCFVSKTFRGSSTDPLMARLRTLFSSVCVSKPRSSRSSSSEAFIIARRVATPIYTLPTVMQVAASAAGRAAVALSESGRRREGAAGGHGSGAVGEGARDRLPAPDYAVRFVALGDESAYPVNVLVPPLLTPPPGDVDALVFDFSPFLVQ